MAHGPDSGIADRSRGGAGLWRVERVISPEAWGKPIADLASGGTGLLVYRNGRAIGFWEAECQTLQPGDVVVEIVPTAGSEAG